MTCYTTDWSKLLSPNSIIRPDITFLVSDDVKLRNKIRGMESAVGNKRIRGMESAVGNKRIRGMESVAGDTKEVKAHIFVLAAVSPVFASQFFGEGWKREESVAVKGSNIKAFETLLDIIYKKDRDNWGLDHKSLYTLFEVLHLADRYDMKEIVDIITKEIGKVKITREHIMEVAAIAEHYKLFEEASKALFKRCGATMNNILKTKGDIINFLADDSDDEVDPLLFKRVLVSMKGSHPSKCTACNKPKEECLDGKDVTPSNLVKGGHVVGKSGGGIGTFYFYCGHRGELVERSNKYPNGLVWKIKNGSMVKNYWIDYDGVSQFVFKCK